MMDVVKDTTERLIKTLNEMNWTFGRGTVVKVEINGTLALNGAGIEGFVVRRIPITQATGFEEKRKFRLEMGRVSFLGRSRVIK